MQTELIVVRKDTLVTEAVELIAKYCITGLPVVEKDMRLIGIISEKDMLKLSYKLMTDVSKGAEDQTVESFMSRDIVSFRASDNLADVCQCFIDNPFRRVPVLEGVTLIGLITRKDIIISAIGKNRLLARAQTYSE